jgi:hypothetical protein
MHHPTDISIGGIAPPSDKLFGGQLVYVWLRYILKMYVHCIYDGDMLIG